MTEQQDKVEELKEVIIYTDGGCNPNPGIGGYGVVLIYGNNKKELSGGFHLTTNNRMELFAAIAGLECLKFPCKIKLYSDSRYLTDAITLGWVKKWQKNGWWRTNKEKAVNIDLWEKLLVMCDKHQIEFEWIEGHIGHQFNERCDKLATIALKQPNLPTDEGYEQRSEENVSFKIVHEGQPCRKCLTPVVKKIPHRKRKSSQTYYFESLLSA